MIASVHIPKLLFGLCTFLIVVVCIRFAAYAPREHKSEPLVTLLSPSVDADGFAIADGESFVEFIYELRNQTDGDLIGLKLDATCQCQVVQPCPEQLKSGDMTTISFRIRSPQRGSIHESIPLLAGTPPRVCATLAGNVRVPFSPPQLLTRPSPIRLTFVRDHSRPALVTFQAVERASAPPWLTDLKFEPPGIVSISSLTIQEQKEPDPTLIRRIYNFHVIGDFDTPYTAPVNYSLRAHGSGQLVISVYTLRN